MEAHPFAIFLRKGPQFIQPLAELLGKGEELTILQLDEATGGSFQQLHQPLHIEHFVVADLQFAAGGKPVSLLANLHLEAAEADAISDPHLFTLGPFDDGFIAQILQLQNQLQAVFRVANQPFAAFVFDPLQGRAGFFHRPGQLLLCLQVTMGLQSLIADFGHYHFAAGTGAVVGACFPKGSGEEGHLQAISGGQQVDVRRRMGVDFLGIGHPAANVGMHHHHARDRINGREHLFLGAFRHFQVVLRPQNFGDAVVVHVQFHDLKTGWGFLYNGNRFFLTNLRHQRNGQPSRLHLAHH